MNQHLIVILIGGHGTGGAAVAVERLLPVWERAGARLTLLANGRSRQAGSEVDLVDLGPSPKLVGGEQSLATLLRILPDLWRAAGLIRRSVRQHPGAVVLPFLTGTGLVTLIATLGLPNRIVVCERNDPSRQRHGWHVRALKRVLYPRAEAISVNSTHPEAVEHLRRVSQGRPVHVVPNVPPAEMPRADPSASRTILAVGRLVPQKNHAALIDAFARVAGEARGWRLQIVGDGPLRDALEAQAERLGVAGSVDLVGQVEDPRPFFARAGIFVLPSVHEGTANALLEAAKAGLPCVVTESSAPCGTRSVMRVIPDTDIDALGHALVELVRQPELRTRSGAAAQRWVDALTTERIVAAWSATLTRPERETPHTVDDAGRDRRTGRAAVLALNEVPSEHAHVGAIVGMANALQKRGHSTNLYMLKRRGAAPVDIEGLGIAPGVRLRTSLGGTRAGQLLSLCAWLMIAALRSHALLLTRSSLVALFARRSGLVLLELHQEPSIRVRSMKFDRLVLPLLRSDRVKFVVITERLRDRIRADFPHLPDSRFVVAPSGFRADWYPERWEPSPGHGRVAYVGSLHPGRGVETVIEVARRLPEAEVLVIGGSVEQWSALVDGQDVPRNCRHRPHMAPHDVPALLNTCDVLLAPYQPEVLIANGTDIAPWMSPLKLVEYKAAGRAIVASDLPMARELVTDGVDGVLVAPSDLEAWVRAVRDLLVDARGRDRLARAAHRAVHGTLDWDTRLERILAAFGRPMLPSDTDRASRRTRRG